MGFFKQKQVSNGPGSSSDPGPASSGGQPSVDAELNDPGLPSEHPRQMYHSNLVAGEGFTWYSADASVAVLVDYVLSLLEVSRAELMHAAEGFAQTADESVFLTAVSGPRGAALTVWGFKPAGTERINNAISVEWDTMMDQMSRGEYRGNPARAKNAAVVRGQLRSDYEGSEVLSVINAASDVVRLDS